MTNDLISREALIDEIRREIDFERENNAPITAVTAFKIAVKRAKQLPTVDAAPVAHGRWVLKTRWDTDGALIVTAECSEGCENEREIWRGYFIDVPDYIAEHTALSNAKMTHLSNYCPNCGAKMDKET